MKVVYKYYIPLPGNAVTHSLPEGAEFVHLGIQEHTSSPMSAWFLVDPSAPPVQREFMLVATGQEFEGDYLQTVIEPASQTVWHLVERPMINAQVSLFQS